MPLNDPVNYALTQSRADARYPLLIDVTTTPGAGKIPRADGSGVIDVGWIPGTYAPASAVILAPGSSARNVITPTADFIPLTIQGFAAQLSDLLKVQDSTGVLKAEVDPNARLTLTQNLSAASLGATLVPDFTSNPSGVWSYSGNWTWNSVDAMSFTPETVKAAALVYIGSGGLGYTVGDTLTLTQGSNDTTVSVLTVSTVGRVTSISLVSGGTASAVANAVATTGGTGTGALINVYQIADSINTLSLPNIAVIAGDAFRLTLTLAGTAGTLANFYATFAGTAGTRIHGNQSVSQTFISTLTGNTTLTLTPTEDFTGTISVITLEKITPTPAAIQTVNNGSTGLAIAPTISGLQNTSVGVSSGANTATGTQNTTFGFQAGRALITGTENLLIGYNAGLLLENGTANVMLGYLAGQNAFFGINNVYLGLSAGQNGRIVNRNVMIGGLAGQLNERGSNNVYIGNAAGQGSGAGTPSLNVAIGNAALANILVGANNTVVGASAGGGLTNGASNVMIGNNAGVSNATGGSNTHLGAGAGSNGLTAGSQVLIGVNAGANEMTGSRLYVAITNTSNPLIYGDFSLGTLGLSAKVGVGVQQPQAKLDVIGIDVGAANFAFKARSLSAELITAAADRTMSGANNWTGTSWAVSGGALVHTAGNTTAASLAAANMTASQIVSGDLYQIAFQITATATRGTLTPSLGATSGLAISVTPGVAVTYTQWITASGNDVALNFAPSTDFNGGVTNVSIKRCATLFHVSNSGVIQMANPPTIIGTGGSNQFLKQTSLSGAVTVAAITSADLTTALTTPPAIGGTTPAAVTATIVTALVNDSATVTVVNAVIADHESDGTPSTNYGTGIAIRGKSSTTANRDMGRIRALWTTATDASRVANVIFSAWNTAEVDIFTLAPATPHMAFTDARDVSFGTSTGTKFGTATTQKIGFWNAAPVVQYATTGTSTGFTAGAGTTATSLSTFTGNTGSAAYTVGDIVRALKLAGIMAS